MFNDEVVTMLKDAAKVLNTTQGQLAAALVQRTLTSMTNDELRALVGDLPAPKKRGRKAQPKTDSVASVAAPASAEELASGEVAQG